MAEHSQLERRKIDAAEVVVPDSDDAALRVSEALLSNERATRLVKAVRAWTLVLAVTTLAAAFWFQVPLLVLVGAGLCGVFLWAVGEIMNLTRDNLTLELLPTLVHTVVPQEAAEEILVRLRRICGTGNKMRPVEYVLLDTLAAVLQPALSRSPSERRSETSPTLDIVFSTLPQHHVRYLLGYRGVSRTRTWVVLPSFPASSSKFSAAWLVPWWREFVWGLLFFLVAMTLRSNVILASIFLFAAPMPSLTLVVAKTRMRRELREACQKFLSA